MALDVSGGIYSQMWTLLEADAAFAAAFRPGNRIKGEDEEKKVAVSSMPSDFPFVRITLGSPDARNVPKVFGQLSTTFSSADVDYPVPMTITGEIHIVHDRLNTNVQTTAEAKVIAPLLAKGPKLGLSYVGGFELGRATVGYRSFGGAKRQVNVIPFTVKAAPMLSQLTS